MATATTSHSFLDSALLRLISLVIAVAIAFLIYTEWGPEIVSLVEGEPAPTEETRAPASEPNPTLDACLANRVGDVDRMKAEGVINDAQYESFRARAVALCQARNPVQ